MRAAVVAAATSLLIGCGGGGGQHAAAGFARRTSRDIVEAVAGSGLAPNTLVYSIGPDAVNLSQPWTGETGTARLRFRSNRWNYAVAFELPAP